MLRITTVLVATLATGQTFAQTSAALEAESSAVPTLPTTLPAPVAAPPACLGLCAGTVVELEIVTPLSSAEHRRGARFELRVVEGLAADGTELIPAGTLGVGEVVHGSAARGGGKPGELLLAGRYLELDGRQLPLRGLKLGAAGKSNAQLALAVSSVAGPFALFIRGQEIEIPAGTRVHAKLAQDVTIDVPTPALPSAAPTYKE